MKVVTIKYLVKCYLVAILSLHILNGVEYFEKPAFQYWFTAIMMKIFGVTEFAGRILPALSAIGCVGLAGF